MSQDQNGCLHPRMAQLPGLVQAGDRQVFRPQLFQLSGHLHGAVAVSVCFHHTQIFDVGAGTQTGLMVIVGQGVQVDLRPGSSQNGIIHGKPFTFRHCTIGVYSWLLIIS